MRGLKVSILMSHPLADEALRLRFLNRKGETPKDCADHIRGQHKSELEDLRSQFPTLFEFRYSEALPFGPLYHANDWAIFGVHLAHASSEKGPMVEVEGSSNAWNSLYRDFRVRWDNPSKLPMP
jgi:hypothetical protein